MRELSKRVIRAAGIEEVARKLLFAINRARRLMSGRDRILIDAYFKTPVPHKLHLGCGPHALDGWLNSDYNPKSEDVLYLDVTKRFPCDADVFDYVFCEHLIEHIHFTDGLKMLVECHRVLKPGGKLRVATPNLQFLVDLYSSDKSELQESFIKHSTDNNIPWASRYEDTFVINDYVRAWGHQFIYDEKVLKNALSDAGFGDVSRRDLNESEDVNLRSLENEERKPAGMIRLETIVVEGTRGF